MREYRYLIWVVGFMYVDVEDEGRRMQILIDDS